MSKAEVHAPFTNYRGTIGKLVYRKVKGKMVVALLPDPDRPVKPREAAHRKRFNEAVVYAKEALSNGARPFYELAAAKKDKPVFAAAVADFLNRPEVKEISLGNYQGLAGGIIHITADDDFGVVKVLVTIRDTADNVIETGDAVESFEGSGSWGYTVQSTIDRGTDIVISATATDRPGGTGVQELSTTITR